MYLEVFQMCPLPPVGKSRHERVRAVSHYTSINGAPPCAERANRVGYEGTGSIGT
jgi:hypothetical protein